MFVVLTPSTAPELVPVVRLVVTSDDVTPNLTLTCTVSGEGGFNWMWSGPQTPVRVWSSDFTRTSTAEFTGVRGLSNADTRYRCSATYNPTISGRSFPMSTSRDFDITFQCKH